MWRKSLESASPWRPAGSTADFSAKRKSGKRMESASPSRPAGSVVNASASPLRPVRALGGPDTTARQGHRFATRDWDRLKDSSFGIEHAKKGHHRRKSNNRAKKRLENAQSQQQQRFSVLVAKSKSSAKGLKRKNAVDASCSSGEFPSGSSRSGNAEDVEIDSSDL